MKKISIVVCILIIFNFICSSYFVYADDEEKDNEETSVGSTSMSISDYKSFAENGKVKVNGENGETEKQVELGDSDIGAVGSMSGGVFVNIFAVAAKIITNVVHDGRILSY